MEHPITVLTLNFPTTTSQRAFDASVKVYLNRYVAAVHRSLNADKHTDNYTDDHTEVEHFDWQDIADSRDFALKDYLEAVDLIETTESDGDFERREMEGYLGAVHLFETPDERERLKEVEAYRNEEIEYPVRSTPRKFVVGKDQDKFEWDMSEAFDRAKQHRQLIRNSIRITWRHEDARREVSQSFKDCYHHVLDMEVFLNTVRQGETAAEMTMRGDEVRYMLFWHKDRNGNWVRA